MNGGDFQWQQRGGFEFLESSTLKELGVSHGFIGKPADFSTASSAQDFANEFEVSTLVLLKQVHGDKVIVWKEDHAQDLTADGVLIHRRKNSLTKIAFGIRSADCLPIIFACPEAVCIVHAGWKGLAQGIERKAFELLSKSCPGQEIQVSLWPCASLSRYEVGAEVIEAVGKQGRCEISENGKFLFGLRETATSSLVANELPPSMIQISPDCTIADPRFHSYRRDGGSSGRNLTFVIV